MEIKKETKKEVKQEVKKEVSNTGKSSKYEGYISKKEK